jgi:hypothetical protein
VIALTQPTRLSPDGPSPNAPVGTSIPDERENALARGDWVRGWPRRLVGNRARCPHNGSVPKAKASAYCETVSVSPCSGLGSCLATTLPAPSRNVISRCGFWATNCSYSLRATLCRLARFRSAGELGVSEVAMLQRPDATTNLVHGDVVRSINCRLQRE